VARVGKTVVGSAAGVTCLGLEIAARDPTAAGLGALSHYVATGDGILQGTKGLAENLPGVGIGVSVVELGWGLNVALREEGCYGGR